MDYKYLHLLLKPIQKSLLHPFSSYSNERVYGLSLDTRRIKSGDLFFAYLGAKFDGRNFIKMAIDKGASAVLYEYTEDEPVEADIFPIPVVPVMHLKQYISQIAALFYEEPSKEMSVVAVTGTNGKTSFCHLLAESLNHFHQRVGVMGTLGNGVWGQLTDSICTTSDPIAVQQAFYQFKRMGVNAVVMEASSHGLEQDRVAAVNFKVGVFTNLTHEHLDYHGDMENYANAKKRLFERFHLSHGIFNLDDEIGRQWFSRYAKDLKAYGYTLNSSLQKQKNTVCAKEISLGHHGIQAILSTPWGEGILESHLLGRFNVSNLLAVLTSLVSLGYRFKEVLEVVQLLKPVPGRMQLIKKENRPLVIIDFAHTPDALEQVLKAAREHCQHQLTCVFGCGGNRDRAKRPVMGRLAEKLADKVILTDDNIRFENSQDIIADIMKGIEDPSVMIIEPERRKAIRLAIEQAEEGDVVLLAGKGHEHYQIIQDHYIPFDEVSIAEEALEN